MILHMSMGITCIYSCPKSQFVENEYPQLTTYGTNALKYKTVCVHGDMPNTHKDKCTKGGSLYTPNNNT